ncbi:cytochrome ubiquinol oxidase subunit I [Thauera sp. ZXT1-4]|uniref:cytochrome ubiquinol oxidase subunit I n=1 Tax=Thauera sp. ZXT1-4 TaxID=3460294 RepID=UPI00404093E1
MKEFPREDRRPVAVMFWSFCIRVGLGVLMILLGAWSLLLRSGGLQPSPCWWSCVRPVCCGPCGEHRILRPLATCLAWSFWTTPGWRSGQNQRGKGADCGFCHVRSPVSRAACGLRRPSDVGECALLQQLA